MKNGKVVVRCCQAWFRHLVLRIDFTAGQAIVIPDAKTIYIPMPKAANSSARRALLPPLGLDPDDFKNIQSDTKHLTVSISKALRQAGPDWFIFTIVRDPTTRAYSAWLNKLEQSSGQFRPLKAMGLRKGDSFERFMRVLMMWPQKMLNDHFIPQSLLLSKARESVNLAVYKVEDLATGWPEICDRIEAQGGTRPLNMPHLNQTKPTAGVKYSARSKRLLCQLYAKDYDTFGYARPK